MQDGYEAYKKYLAIKLHFTKDRYDYFKFNGQTKASYESFIQRNDKYFFIKTARKLQMAWGVHSCLGQDAQTTREMVANACTIVKKADLAKAEDSIVITAGVPFGNAGSTNLLRIAKIVSDEELT